MGDDLVFDLASLKFVTSTRTGPFFHVPDQLGQKGGTTSFVNLPPQVAEILDIRGRLPAELQALARAFFHLALRPEQRLRSSNQNYISPCLKP